MFTGYEFLRYFPFLMWIIKLMCTCAIVLFNVKWLAGLATRYLLFPLFHFILALQFLDLLSYWGINNMNSKSINISLFKILADYLKEACHLLVKITHAILYGTYTSNSSYLSSNGVC